MILVLFRDAVEVKAAAVVARLAAFFSRVPVEKTERTDRRRFRWVLCGEHGFVRNFRETCPDCGGYAEPLKNQVMAKRLAKRRLATSKLLRARRTARMASAELLTASR